IDWALDYRLAPILLKKSKIAKPRKSCEIRMLAISAAARLLRTDTNVGGRFNVIDVVPHIEHARRADCWQLLKI
ncbi:MAG: hypothetical protein WAM50_16735, partial [Pseudolabrys sp.]